MPAFVSVIPVSLPTPPMCASFSATTPVAAELDVCVITVPMSTPLSAIDEVSPTVTLFENVSIGTPVIVEP